MKCFIDGDKLVLARDDFVNLQESPVMFLDADSAAANTVRALNVPDDLMEEICWRLKFTRAYRNSKQKVEEALLEMSDKAIHLLACQQAEDLLPIFDDFGLTAPRELQAAITAKRLWLAEAFSDRQLERAADSALRISAALSDDAERASIDYPDMEQKLIIASDITYAAYAAAQGPPADVCALDVIDTAVRIKANLLAGDWEQNVDHAWAEILYKIRSGEGK